MRYVVCKPEVSEKDVVTALQLPSIPSKLSTYFDCFDYSKHCSLYSAILVIAAVVSIDWISECIKSGKRVETAQFIVRPKPSRKASPKKPSAVQTVLSAPRTLDAFLGRGPSAVEQMKFSVIERGSAIETRCGDNIRHTARVAAFDMDGTLLVPQSGRAFPKDRFDWKFWHHSVPAVLKQLHDADFKIVVFTNQEGITIGK